MSQTAEHTPKKTLRFNLEVPYISLSNLDEVLDSLVERKEITEYQQHLLKMEVRDKRDIVLMNASERKDLNELREQCLREAHLVKRRMMSVLADEERRLSIYYHGICRDIEDEKNETSNKLRGNMRHDLADNQKRIDELNAQIEMLTDTDCATVADIKRMRDEANVAKRNQTALKAACNIALADAISYSRIRRKDAGESWFSDTLAIQHRRRKLHEAYKALIDWIRSAPAESLPEVYGQIQIRLSEEKGGEA